MEQTRGTGAQSAANLQKSNTPHAAFGAPFSARVFYCPACDVPIVTPDAQVDEVTGKSLCPLCGGATRYLATDLRPVFPEERLLLELLLGAEPLSLAEKSVWAQDSRYYIGGKARSVPAKVFSGADTDGLSGRLERLKNQNASEEITGRFESQVQRFVRANRPRLNALVNTDGCGWIGRKCGKGYCENTSLIL